MGLDLRLALRLFEAGLPEPQNLARSFFADPRDEWSSHVLALCDSPSKAARVYGLQLLSEFRERWTPDLLRQLAQHDDPNVQTFVASCLLQESWEGLPDETKEAMRSFDRSILNGRGRARGAKEKVKARLKATSTGATGANTAGGMIGIDADILREAARSGAKRDREWALAQLVRAALEDAPSEGLTLRGAVLRARELESG